MSHFDAKYEPISSTDFYDSLIQNVDFDRVTGAYLKKYKRTACSLGGTWNSLPFQEFIKVFMGQQTPYNSLLVIWGTGVGKTCGAVQVTETLRNVIQLFGKKIYVIAPANLQENYKDTLSGPCGNEGREPSETYKFFSYMKFGAYVLKLYQAEGVEGLHKLFNNSVFVIDEAHNLNNLKDDDDDPTIPKRPRKGKKNQNRALTVNENNVITGFEDYAEDYIDDEDYDIEELDNTKSADRSQRLLNILELLFKNVQNSKLLLLTATPIRNEIVEIVSLLNLLRLNNKVEPVNERILFDKNNQINTNYLFNVLKGYVSFVRGNSQISFPSVINMGEIIKPYPSITVERVNIHDNGLQHTPVIPCTLQSYQLSAYLQTVMKSSQRHSFFINAASVANVALPLIMEDGRLTTESLTGKGALEQCIHYDPKTHLFRLLEHGYINNKFFLARENLPYFSVKLDKLLTNLLEPGVHYVYSRLVEFGVNMVSIACQLYGWNLLTISNGEPRYMYNIDPNNDIEPRCYCGILRSEHTRENHTFVQGHIVTYTGKMNADQKVVQTILSIVNSKENNLGQLCKVFIGSRVSGEGVNYRRLRYVHILEPWWNNTVLQQVIGRAVRNCSHYDLPKDQQNVQVYRYATVMPRNMPNEVRQICTQTSSYFYGNMVDAAINYVDNAETVDLYFYRTAENKDISIAWLTRVLKMVAVDCVHNYIWNRVFTDKEIEEIRQTGRIMMRDQPFYIDPEVIPLLNRGNDNNAECEFMQCHYNCMAPYIKEGKSTTYVNLIMNQNNSKITQRIKEIISFLGRLDTPIFDLAHLFKKLNVSDVRDQGITFDALTEMLVNPDITFEWNHQTGRLVLLDSHNILFSFDAYAQSFDSDSLEPYFKYANVFTRGSNLDINVKQVPRFDIPVTNNEIMHRIQHNLNEAVGMYRFYTLNVRQDNDNYILARMMELFDNMNGKILTGRDSLSEFNYFYEYVIDHEEELDPMLISYLQYYMIMNHRSTEQWFRGFYIAHTTSRRMKAKRRDELPAGAQGGETQNQPARVPKLTARARQAARKAGLLVLKGYDWHIQYYCRVRLGKTWTNVRITYFSMNTANMYDVINFDEMNTDFSLEIQVRQLYKPWNISLEERHIYGSIMRELIEHFVQTGSYNAREQGGIVYGYFAPPSNVRIVFQSRGMVKRDNSPDKRTLSTGQVCSTIPKKSITNMIQYLQDNPHLKGFIDRFNYGMFKNMNERCKDLEIALRMSDLHLYNMKRWFYMYGDYDLNAYTVVNDAEVQPLARDVQGGVIA